MNLLPSLRIHALLEVLIPCFQHVEGAKTNSCTNSAREDACRRVGSSSVKRIAEIIQIHHQLESLELRVPHVHVLPFPVELPSSFYKPFLEHLAAHNSGLVLNNEAIDGVGNIAAMESLLIIGDQILHSQHGK